MTRATWALESPGSSSITRCSSSLPGFGELHPVVTAGRQIGGDGGAGWNLPRLVLPVHLDVPLGKPHIHPAAGLAVCILVVIGDRLAVGMVVGSAIATPDGD
jgi:hypothetical protein